MWPKAGFPRKEINLAASLDQILTPASATLRKLVTIVWALPMEDPREVRNIVEQSALVQLKAGQPCNGVYYGLSVKSH